MRVLMINHFPLEGSGSGTYTKNLAMQLSACGHEVHVVMPENTQDFPRYEGVGLHPVFFTAPGEASDAVPAGALPFNFPCFTTHPRSLVAFSDLTGAQLEAYLGAFREAIRQELAGFQPDVVHGQHVWMLPWLAAGAGAPLVLTAHGTDLMGYGRWPQFRRYADEAVRAARRVVCISRDNEALVRQTWPDAAGKVVRMRNGFNPAIFFPQRLDRAAELARFGVRDEGGPLVLFAGKLTRFKGVDVLLSAAARWERARPDALTCVAGDGEERASLEAQARDLGLSRVRFLGNVSQEQLCRLYNVADVDLVPSRREPFGLVAVEAMACGTPVVASDEGGLPDFVCDQVGALVPPENPAALADAVLGVLDRAAARPEWRQGIVAYAQHYSQAAVIGQLEALYRSVA